MNESRTFWAAVLTAAFMLAEAAGGWLSGSLALLADAAHMMTDSVSLGLAWYAFRLSRRPPTERHTFGYDRLQVLVAFGNGIAMLIVVLLIVGHAVERLFDPVAVLPGPLLVIAGLGLGVNLVAFGILHGADTTNLNVRGALLHVLGDLLGSVAAITSGAVIWLTGFMTIDPILSVFVATLLARSAIALVRDSGRILLEAVPLHLDIAEVRQDLEAHIDHVVSIHHVHAWCLTQERHMVTLHAQVKDANHRDSVAALIKERLRREFGIAHATVEVELVREVEPVKNCAG
ncbi:MAG: cation diffusion facilitator family transporter [Myxococcota bacterium]